MRHHFVGLRAWNLLLRANWTTTIKLLRNPLREQPRLNARKFPNRFRCRWLQCGVIGRNCIKRCFISLLLRASQPQTTRAYLAFDAQWLVSSHHQASWPVSEVNTAMIGAIGLLLELQMANYEPQTMAYDLRLSVGMDNNGGLIAR